MAKCAFCEHCNILNFDDNPFGNSVCLITGEKIHISDEPCELYLETRDVYNIDVF